MEKWHHACSYNRLLPKAMSRWFHFFRSEPLLCKVESLLSDFYRSTDRKNRSTDRIF